MEILFCILSKKSNYIFLLNVFIYIFTTFSQLKKKLIYKLLYKFRSGFLKIIFVKAYGRSLNYCHLLFCQACGGCFIFTFHYKPLNIKMYYFITFLTYVILNLQIFKLYFTTVVFKIRDYKK